MKTAFLATLFLVVSVVGKAVPQPQQPNRAAAGGTGPYPASYKTDPGLPNHTIYVPNGTPSTTLPVLLWGNGACGANGLAFQNFLTQVASHGILVIANGRPNGSGSSTSEWMKNALRWVRANAGKAGYERVDASRVGVAGQSCGGLEAYELRNENVVTIGIFNSGVLNAGDSARIAGGVKAPIFYFLGGSSDIAYPNGERDYDLLPGTTPAWKGNLPVGHDGTYWSGDGIGGKFGVAAVNWVKWLLRRDESGKAFFTGDGAARDGWSVERKALERIVI